MNIIIFFNRTVQLLLSISNYTCIYSVTGLPWWLSSKESDCSAGDLGLIPELGRSPRGGHGNPLQYSCLENPMDRGAWRATAHRVTESRTRLKRHSMHTCMHIQNGLEGGMIKDAKRPIRSLLSELRCNAGDGSTLSNTRYLRDV